MEKYSLKTMLRTAHRYEVAIYRYGGGDKDYNLSKEYKTYRGAVAYAAKMSRDSSLMMVEVWDMDTDRDYYVEDICASQEYVNGKICRDGYDILG